MNPPGEPRLRETEIQMGSENGAVAEPAVEEQQIDRIDEVMQRPSLLDVVQEKIVTAKGDAACKIPGVIPARIVLLCENREKVTGKDEAEAFWTEILTAAGSGDGDARCAVLAYPEATITAIEGTTSTVGDVAREIESVHDRVAADKGQYASVRVVSTTEDMAKFVLPGPGVFASFVNSPTAEAYEELEPARVFKATSAVNIAVLGLGMKLRGMSSGERELALKDISAVAPELPTLKQLMGLLKQPEGAPTLNEFLEVYDSPLDVDLDGENVWPMPPTLKF